jgi:hypothetical protein
MADHGGEAIKQDGSVQDQQYSAGQSQEQPGQGLEQQPSPAAHTASCSNCQQQGDNVHCNSCCPATRNMQEERAKAEAENVRLKDELAASEAKQAQTQAEIARLKEKLVISQAEKSMARTDYAVPGRHIHVLLGQEKRPWSVRKHATMSRLRTPG